MRALLLVLEVGGEPRRYTTAPEAQSIGGEAYRPGLDLKRCAVFALGQTSATVSDADTDWVTILLGYSGPPGCDCTPTQAWLSSPTATRSQ
mgnify:CR=1 FL=1